MPIKPAFTTLVPYGVNYVGEEIEILPCSPNKILLSDIMTIKPYKRILPVGFNTLLFKKDMDPFVDRLDNTINELDNGTHIF